MKWFVFSRVQPTEECLARLSIPLPDLSDRHEGSVFSKTWNVGGGISITILLVDDEKGYSTALAKRLQVRNFIVANVYGGDEALDLLATTEFDVIILDVLMPRKNGHETFEEINRRYPDIPVIMHTGHASVETAIRYKKKGLFDYAVKPVELNELIEKISLAYAYRVACQKRKKIIG